MQRVRLTSGLIAERLTEDEQNKVWDILGTNTVIDIPFFTPNDNLKYFIIDRSEENNYCIDTIKANDKTFTVKAKIEQLDRETLKAIRKAYKG